MKRRGRFAKRNAGAVSRRPLHDAHVSAWLWSEQRWASLGYLAVINGELVNYQWPPAQVQS